MAMVRESPPRAPPVRYTAQYGTRWQKEKAAAVDGAFEYPQDAKYVGPWIMGECVGKGASGHVKIAKHCKTGQLAAVKILSLDMVFSSHVSLNSRLQKFDKQRLGIDKEITMMKLMNHPNIMRIYDVYEGDQELYLILEYVEGGELFDFIVNRGKLPPLEALAYFKQIVYGLSYAHAFSIIHRDLKPENILIHSLNPPLIKIADWGMATFAPPSLELDTSCGSPHYASPEIVNGHKYQGTATDIWSCGVILFALLTGRLPFDDKDVRTLLSKVKKGRFEMPAWVDPQAKDLLYRMLVVDVSQRITMSELLTHPWLSNDTPGILYVPAPSVAELARPLRSAAHIDPDILEFLCVVWGRHAGAESVKSELLSPAGEGTLAKAFYFLLKVHRQRTLEGHGIFMDVDEPVNTPRAKAITKLYMSPLSKKDRPVSLGSSSHIMLSPKAPAMERNQTAPANCQSAHGTQNSQNSMSPARRSRPITPAGPRGHRPRPMSTPMGIHPTDLIPTGGQDPTSSVISAQTAPVTGHRSSFFAANPYCSSSQAGQGQNGPIVDRHSQRTMHGSYETRSQIDPFQTPMSAPPGRTSFALSPPTMSPPAPVLTFSPINAPRVTNQSFQRTMDDVAGRMNVLSADYARAQVQARAEALESAVRSSSEYTSSETPSVVSRSSDEYYLDKENVRMPGRRGTYLEVDDGQAFAGLGLGKNAMGRNLGPDSPTFASQKSPIIGSPVVGEFKGWFSNLFTWKAQVYALHSLDGLDRTRAEGLRLLSKCNVQWEAVDGVLHCRVPEAYDPATGAILIKGVRFRTEFISSLSNSGIQGVASPPRKGAALAPTGPYQCVMVLVQERGATSTFRMVYYRLREEWRMDAMQSPALEFEFVRQEDVMDIA
ncbi:kinase-like domain-containing protein [Amylostereum chailletii]|nr:kinase-like domain-containing protein [Amylostereum chailletii]